MKSIFKSDVGLRESFLAFSVERKGSFREEAEEAVRRLLEEAGGDMLVFVRFHVSDVSNQQPILEEVARRLGCLIAVVGQAPTNRSHLAVEAYALSGGIVAYCEAESRIRILLDNYELLYFNKSELASTGSHDQMNEEFLHAQRILGEFGGTIKSNLQRTWIYCRDIDNNYEGLVVARRELFEQQGLNQETHYIASTGIEGMSHPWDRLVRMDGFALFGHQQEQIDYMSAPDNLSPTHLYGVTFERGTRIVFGDRSKFYVSGTASIDCEGKVMHVQDVAKQTHRVVDNVIALMERHCGALSDLKQAVVYLRDPADSDVVESVLRERLPQSLPRIMVYGSVCRPEWLVEMEAVGVNGVGDSRFKDFA